MKLPPLAKPLPSVIVYLHGFNSSPDSRKAHLLRDFLIARGRGNEFICPRLPWRFSQAAALIETTLRGFAGQPVCLVGSSLGGFYATHFAERYGLAAVLVNPAVDAHESLAGYLGAQQNLYSGEEYVLEATHVQELALLAHTTVSRPERYLLLAQTGDEVLDYRLATRRFAAAEQVVSEGGDHAFQGFESYLERVVAFADAHAATGIMRG